jgi:hypothetical protein
VIEDVGSVGVKLLDDVQKPKGSKSFIHPKAPISSRHIRR